jgi:hypothetical protein
LDYSGTDDQTEGVQYYDLQATNNDNSLYDETTGHRVDTSVDSEYTYIENIQNNSLKENVASNNEVNDQNSILNPDVPQANTTFDAETSSPGHYAILDPKATGFNRSKEDITDDYELATPISSADAGDIEESEYPTYSGLSKK